MEAEANEVGQLHVYTSSVSHYTKAIIKAVVKQQQQQQQIELMLRWL